MKQQHGGMLWDDCEQQQTTDTEEVKQPGEHGATIGYDLRRKGSKEEGKQSCGGKKITGKRLYELLHKQKFMCPLTGRKLTPSNCSVDHIIPLKDGGGHCMENIWVVHSEVNAAKGVMSADRFISLCIDIAAHVMRTEDNN